MNKDSFEKALKNSMHDTASDIDLDAAWSTLQARRRKPRRRVFFWLFAGLGLLICSAGAWWWMAAKQPAALPPNAPFAQNSMPNHGNTPALPQAATASDPTGPALHTEQREPENFNTATAAVAFKGNKGFSPVHTTVTPVAPENLSSASLMGVPPPTKSEPRELIHPNTPHFLPSQQAFPVMAFLPLDLSPLDFNPNPASAPSLVIMTPGIKKKVKVKAKNWWLSTQAQYGSNLVSRTGDPALIQDRSDENQLDLLQAGILLRRRIKGRWFVETGLQYTQWTDVRRWTQQKTYTETRPDLLLRQLINADGSVETFYGPGMVTVQRNQAGETFNRYQHVEWPLMTGLNWPMGRKWQFDLSAGANLALYSDYSGTVSTSSGDTELRALPYRSFGMVSLQVQTALLYNSRIGALGLSLHSRSSLNSSTINSSGFKEKRRSLGVGLLWRGAF